MRLRQNILLNKPSEVLLFCLKLPDLFCYNFPFGQQGNCGNIFAKGWTMITESVKKKTKLSQGTIYYTFRSSWVFPHLQYSYNIYSITKEDGGNIYPPSSFNEKYIDFRPDRAPPVFLVLELLLYPSLFLYSTQGAFHGLCLMRPS